MGHNRIASRALPGLLLGGSLVIAACLAAMTAYVMRYDEADAAFFAAAGGVAITLAARGIVGLTHRGFPWFAYAAAPVLGAALAVVVLLFGEPVAARGWENRTWDDLVAEEQAEDFDPERWVQRYELSVAPEYRRPQWRAHYLNAVTRKASREREPDALREAISRLDRAKGANPDLELSDSRALAESDLDALYDEALRAFERRSPPDPTRVDPELRAVVATLLQECKRTRSAAIELRVSSQTRMHAPDGFVMPRGVELIPPGDVFGERWQEHRDNVLVSTVSHALRELAPSDLIEISSASPPMPAPAIQIHLEIDRTRSFYLYSAKFPGDVANSREGVFGIRVSWRAQLLSADGSALYDWAGSTTPADEIGFESERLGDDVPYRVLISSSYAKLAEELLARAGLPGPTHDELMESFSG